jgi:ubiquinone/menaquinone biosynthesis C-methylase UbiE
VDLKEYRESNLEQNRIRDLIRLISNGGESAIDIGARDGYISVLLTDYFNIVTALDLDKPLITHERVCCVKGDITELNFPDESFDLVFCAEVLEHLPQQLLDKACFEIRRVAKKHVLIGVPFKQDIRIGQTTCYSCSKRNPPWGHVNVFDEDYLTRLFPEMKVESISFIGENNEATNFMSTYLMDLAGNPYGTYTQEEQCIHCGSKLIAPYRISYFQKVLTKFAFYLNNVQSRFIGVHPNWIHILFKKNKI